MVFRSNPGSGKTTADGQSLTARKLGAVSTSGRPVDESQPPSTDELFNIVLTNRTSIVFLSQLTGGFLVRGKQNILDSNGVAFEPFYLRVTKRHTYRFFARKCFYLDFFFLRFYWFTVSDVYMCLCEC
ncbi:unnamed protein product [Trichobilharzia regenti]|nr:unnamed protein product [Trichobilharzia regenti]